jgi:hypothetical protein
MAERGWNIASYCCASDGIEYRKAPKVPTDGAGTNKSGKEFSKKTWFSFPKSHFNLFLPNPLTNYSSTGNRVNIAVVI